MNGNWWPSKHGQADQIGMLNEITPAKVAEAARLVRSGRVVDLSHPLDQHVPAFPGRSFRQSLHTTAHQENRRRPDSGGEGWGSENINWIIDVVYGTSQMGTHLDGLNHLQRGDR
ncbi:MAG TPA: cyclase family protein, partial [Anaerolineales bacterium]|nr:cyclase family protein [Anaerolineales bacterium]